MTNKFEIKPGELIKDRYEIKKLIGQGGMGKTYLTLDKQSGTDVVLKVLVFREAGNWKIIELFEREVKALKNMDFSLIPHYIDNFEWDLEGESLMVLAQDFIDGENLYKLIKEGKRFQQKEIENILMSLLETLVYIHNLNPPIIHRDINPKNIILAKDNKVYVVDFGAVGDIIKDTMAASMSSTFVGTLGYMPPEQFYGKISPASDIYSLAMTMIFLLSGKEPSEFDFKDMKVDYKNFINCPRNLIILIDRMIEPNMDQRIQNAKQALDILTIKASLKATKKKKVGKSRIKTIEKLFEAERKDRFAQITNAINNTIDVNKKDSKGRSILKIAFDQKRMQMVKFLISHGAEFNDKYKGNTLLHEAVLKDDLEKAKILLKNGASISIKNNKHNKTPFELAHQLGKASFKELFLKYGAENIEETITQSLKNLPPKRKLGFHFLARVFTFTNKPISDNFVFAFFLGLILSFLYLGAGFNWFPELRLWYSQDYANGVIKKVISTNIIIDYEEDDEEVYKYHYEFKASNGKLYKNFSYAPGHWRLGQGRKVQISYVRSNPEISIIKNTWFSKHGGSYNLVVILISLLVSFFLMFLLWNHKNFIKYTRLLRKGLLADGRVVESVELTVVQKVYLKYEYVEETTIIERIFSRSEQDADILIEYIDEKAKITKNSFIIRPKTKEMKKNDILPILYFTGKKEYSMYLDISCFNFHNGRWNFLGHELSLYLIMINLIAKMITSGFLIFYIFRVFFIFS